MEKIRKKHQNLQENDSFEKSVRETIWALVEALPQMLGSALLKKILQLQNSIYQLELLKNMIDEKKRNFQFKLKIILKTIRKLH